MRSFILRARKGSSDPEKLLSNTGTGHHSEIIAHTLTSAFFLSQDMRNDVEVFIVLDSASDFPRTLRFFSHPELSFPGFHDQAILNVVGNALLKAKHIGKDQTLHVLPGISVYGFGFDKLVQQLQVNRPVYLLDKKGHDIRSAMLSENAVFVLTDHIPMPKNSVKCIEKRGGQKICLGPKMLFASQCVILIHNELDRGL